MNATNVATPARAAKRRPRILVIDDEVDLLEILSLELNDAGYEVTTVGTGQEALRRARQEHFDVVLTDYKMPGMDGLETLAALENVAPTTRAVLMTGYASDEVEAALSKSGRPRVSKPFDLDKLLATLDNERRR